MAGQDHGVVLGELDELVLAPGQQRQGGHRLTLGSGGDDADLPRRVAVDVLDVDQLARRDRHDAQVDAELNVLADAHAQRGDLAPAVDRRVGDLLDAVQMAGEARRDHPTAPALGEERAQHAPDGGLAGSVSRLLGVGRVGEEHADPGGAGELADSSQVGAPTVDRGEVELEVSAVQDDTLGGVHGDGVGVRHAVGDRDELDVELADRHPIVVDDDAQFGVAEQAGLLDPVAGEAESHRRAVDRHLDLAQQVLQSADVVLVTVRGDNRDDPPGVLAQVREVREHEVDAVHVRVGEHQAAVDEQDLTVGTIARRATAELDRHAVAADLAEPAEEDDANGVAPDESRARPRWPGQPRAATSRLYTSAARLSNQSGSGPSGGRQRPAGWPR